MSNNKSISYFPGLNSLRFFAAFSVVISHVELIKAALGLKNDYRLMERLNFGGLGVYFFFVLSGFLITYLLLKEKETTSTIAIKKFYLRRVFRIWPLYFLILVLGFFVLPQIHIIDLPYQKLHFEKNFFGNLVLYLLILPNLAFSIFPAVPHIGQSWSIGVEEQFYLFWPIALKKIRSVFKLILISFGLILFFKIILLFMQIQFPTIKWLLYLKTYVAMSKFESMMIGAFGAYLFFENKKVLLNFVYNPIVLYLSILLFFPLNYFTFNSVIQNGIHIPISIMFMIIILNISTNKSCKLKLENRIFNYLGNISYGIYMYHLIVIPIVLVIFKSIILNNSLMVNVLVYVLSVLISILVATLSYELFEMPFLRIKKKFEVK